MPPLTFSPTDHIFILTGAGVSAESGIPTFRDANGLWCNYRIEDVATPIAWRRDPRLVWDFYSMRRRDSVHAKPNPAHIAIASLQQELGERLYLCTQNIDNLHEQAGSPRVVHMHGELFKSRCESCSRPPFEDTHLHQSPDAIPRCECGAQIRPHICWFGEMPYDLDDIYATLDRCTVFFAIGTSGTVEPAASFAAHAARHAKTYYVGPEPPANRYIFHQAFPGKAGEILPTLFA